MAKQQKKFIIIDANAVLHRSFHALPPLTTKKGQVVNAMYGFLTVLFKVWREFKPSHMAVAFDVKKKTFRHQKYAEYKAGRAKTPDELYEQIPLVKEVLAAFGIAVYEKEGYEADDLIGTIVEHNIKKGIDNIIVTGDKDAFQLIDSHTKVYTMRQGMADTVIYDAKAFEERYELQPHQLIDFKAIAGDPSDNIPGVKGIGEKGATSLLKQFGSIEAIYEEITKKGDKSKIQPRYLKLLQEHKKEALLSKMLATIVRDVPIKYKAEDCLLKPYDKQKIFKLFQEFEFKSLLARLPEIKGDLAVDAQLPKLDAEAEDSPAQDAKSTGPAKSKVQYKLINTDSDFADFYTELKKQPSFAIDTETTSTDPFLAKLLGISFCWRAGQAFYLNVKDNPIWLKKLKPLLEDDQVSKFGQNIKYDIAVLWQVDINLKPVGFDSMVASYLLNPGSRGHGLDNLAFEVFGYQMQSITDLIGKGKKQISMEVVPLDKVSWYACEDADYTYQLCRYFRPELEEKNLLGLMEKIELPLIPILARLEQNGVKIDAQLLGGMSKEASHKLLALEKKIYHEAKTTFNINSPLQLKEVLFEKLKISSEGISRTKTGISTAAAELEKMRDSHAIIPLIQEYREVAKLRSTYLEALPKLINPKTGRVHTSFNQTVTATGRLSSSEPNLQNIPIRTEAGRKIRNAFIAEPGFKLLAADYSQIELRIIASLANDASMIASFQEDEDIHRRTAADVNGIPIAEVTKQQRYEAKEVNFGILYGMGAWGLASRQGMSRDRARAFIEKYFATHQEIQEYLATTINLAHEQGYVETLFGRRRYLSEINSSMPQVRAAAERMAVNMPVQGTAADLMKVAMINIHSGLPKVSPRTKMILQVHDELVFEVPDAEVKKVADFVNNEMNNVYKLKVPIKTEIEVGDNWGELKELK
ncbi:DNA polymerase I [Patescibacteria group bacterium]|nr:DNA polymerase I [Patescibacteria group bacterium]